MKEHGIKIGALAGNGKCWWMPCSSRGIVISSRVRLARNIEGIPFPWRAGSARRVRFCQDMKQILGGIIKEKDLLFVETDKISRIDKQFLMEEQLVSREFADRSSGSAVAIDRNSRIALMVNEEDHLRIQCLSAGMNLDVLWEKASEFDSILEKNLNYAFNSQLGFLTACPTNVGTGLRASVMLHLAGLSITREIDQVIKGLNRMFFAVRGIYGEGSDARGAIFQISNGATLGESEDEIISGLTHVIKAVIKAEENARKRLMINKKVVVEDQTAKALGILQNARLLTSREAIDLLAGIRFGIDVGVLKGVDIVSINRLMLMVQPGHMQKNISSTMTSLQRDCERAVIVKDCLKKAVLE